MMNIDDLVLWRAIYSALLMDILEALHLATGLTEFCIFLLMLLQSTLQNIAIIYECGIIWYIKKSKFLGAKGALNRNQMLISKAQAVQHKKSGTK